MIPILMPIFLLIYGAATYSKRSKPTQFIIKLGWAILIIGVLGNIYYYYRA
jgi:hypothetical protein